MKKVFLFSALAALALSLSSCKVNWFGETIDAPWYTVAIPVILIFAVAYVILMSRTFVCPYCKTEFKAKPHQLYVMVHFNGKRIAKCPNCNRKGFCETKR